MTKGTPVPTFEEAFQYLRVSDDLGGLSPSTESQEAENQEAADDRGIRITRTFLDDGVSASRYATKVRKGFASLLCDIESGALDNQVMIVWESSRGSRRASEFMRLIEECVAHGIKWFVTSENRLYDIVNNTHDRHQLQTAGVNNEYESAKISGRVTRGTKRAAIAGKPHGRLHFGYDRVYEGSPPRVVGMSKNLAESAVVEHIFKSIAAGHSIESVVRWLRECGVTPKRKENVWGRDAVRHIVKNPTYIQKRRHRKDGMEKLYDTDRWPRLVEEDLFYRANAVLSDPRRRTSFHRPGQAKHLLSGIAVCGKCGQNRVSLGTRRGASKAPAYFCRDSCVLVNQEKADELIHTLVVLHLSHPDFVDRYLAHADNGAAAQAARDEAARLRAEWEGLMARSSPLYKGADKVTAEYVMRMQPDYVKAIEQAEADVMKQAIPPSIAWVMAGPLEEVEDRWRNAPVAAQRDTLRELMTIRVLPTGRHGGGVTPIEQRITVEWNQVMVA